MEMKQNGYESNPIMNQIKATSTFSNATPTSFLPIHQSHNSIYQSTNLSMINNHHQQQQQQQHQTSPPTLTTQTALINRQPTLQHSNVLQSKTSIGHLYPSSLIANYSGHSSFHHQPIQFKSPTTS